MKIETLTRRFPPGPWSHGSAFIQWPNRYNQGEAIVAAFYSDCNELLADYRRAVEWRKVSGIVARTHSLKLEKTPEGQAWIDFGIRSYRHRNSIPDTCTDNVLEDPAERIALLVLAGGKNRMRVFKEMASVRDLYLMFVLYDPNDANDTLTKKLHRLLYGTLGPSLGIPPIRLTGIFTLGKMAYTMRPDLLGSGCLNGT